MDEKMSIEIVKNEYRDLLYMSTDRLSFKVVEKSAGSLALIEVTVKVPTYYITGSRDTDPKPTDVIKFYIDIPEGYPEKKPHVYFEKGKILAAINTFTTGSQCIDKWHYDSFHSGRNSNLEGTVRKTVQAIIYDTSVFRYDSMANSLLARWQMDMTNKGVFPTISLGEVIRSEGSVSPVRTTSRTRQRTACRPCTRAKIAPPLPSC